MGGVYLREVWADKRCALTKGMHFWVYNYKRCVWEVYFREVWCTYNGVSIERCVVMKGAH